MALQPLVRNVSDLSSSQFLQTSESLVILCPEVIAGL